MARGIYRTARGRNDILRRYNAAVADLGVPVEDRNVPTAAGETHVLVLGPADAPPVVVFGGGNFLGPLSLSWFSVLFDRMRVYAPDTVGHPGKSAETRLSARDSSYGRWALEVLDALDLPCSALGGPSFGAAIALQAAALAPERVTRLALLVPAGIVRPAMGPMLRRLALPMLVYRAFPHPDRLERAVAPLFTDEPGRAWLGATRAVFRHVRITADMPRSLDDDELARIEMPTYVAAAEHDVLFPGESVLARARDRIPGLTAADLLEGSSHVPSADDLDVIVRRMAAFLVAAGG